MKNIVAPLFEDEEFLNMVIEAMKSDPQFGGMAGMMVPTLKYCLKSSKTRLNWR
mgnify:CR=1 FL=1